jgi:hypothetical protein
MSYHELTEIEKFQPEISLELCKEFLHVKENAIRQAANESPNEHDVHFDGPQQEIVGHYEEQLTLVRQNCLERDKSYARQRNAIGLENTLRELERSQHKTLEGYESELADSKIELEELREKEREKLRALRQFKGTNGIIRDAYYPDSAFDHLSLVFALVGIEGLFNWRVFHDSDTLSGTDAMLLGVFIAVTNLLVALASGYFFMRWRNHSDAMIKKIGHVCSIIAIIVIIFFNGSVAMYRFSLNVVEELNFLDFLEILISVIWKAGSNPTLAFTPESIILFLVGLVAAGVSCYKGYTLDDPFPNYGAVTRNYIEADEKFKEERLFVLSNASRLSDQAHDAINQLVRIARTEVTKFQELLEASEAERKDFENTSDRIQDLTNQLLAYYRDINKSVRTEDAPEYFNTLYRLKGIMRVAHPDSSFYDLSSDQKKEKEMQTFMENIENAANSIHKTIQSKHEEMMERIQTMFDRINRSSQQEQLRNRIDMPPPPAGTQKTSFPHDHQVIDIGNSTPSNKQKPEVAE